MVWLCTVLIWSVSVKWLVYILSTPIVVVPLSKSVLYHKNGGSFWTENQCFTAKRGSFWTEKSVFCRKKGGHFQSGGGQLSPLHVHNFLHKWSQLWSMDLYTSSATRWHWLSSLAWCDSLMCKNAWLYENKIIMLIYPKDSNKKAYKWKKIVHTYKFSNSEILFW